MKRVAFDLGCEEHGVSVVWVFVVSFLYARVV